MEDDHGVLERLLEECSCASPCDLHELRRAMMLKQDALEYLPNKLPKNSLQKRQQPSQLEALPPEWRPQRGNNGQCRSSQPHVRGGNIDAAHIEREFSFPAESIFPEGDESFSTKG